MVKVDPRNTSVRCRECGNVDKANRPSRDRFVCVACGHTAHADTNAACNILTAGLAVAARESRDFIPEVARTNHRFGRRKAA